MKHQSRFAPTFQGLYLNALRSAPAAIDQLGRAFLKKTNLMPRIKKKWRARRVYGRSIRRQINADSPSTQLLAERLLGEHDAKFFEDPLREVDQLLAHYVVNRPDRATLDCFRRSPCDARN